MNTVIVWVLMTTSGHNGTVTYSPAFPTQAECQRVLKLIPKSFNSTVGSRNNCVEMALVK